MVRGDHIYVNRIGYKHHGIDCGDGTVIHYDGDKVCQIMINQFCDGEQFYIENYFKCDSNEVAYHRAVDRLGENEYDLIYNNCEHFACYCKTGISRSKQVVNLISKFLPHVGTIFEELKIISSQLNKIELKFDLSQEAKLSGSIQNLKSALDVSDIQLVRQCVHEFSCLYEYYFKYLKLLCESKLAQSELPSTNEIFIKYTELALISNFSQFLGYFFLGYKDKAIEIFEKSEINELIKCIRTNIENEWMYIPSGANFICHPNGITIDKLCSCHSSLSTIPSIIPFPFSLILRSKKDIKDELIQFSVSESSYLKIETLFGEFEKNFSDLIF